MKKRVVCSIVGVVLLALAVALGVGLTAGGADGPSSATVTADLQAQTGLVLYAAGATIDGASEEPNGFWDWVKEVVSRLGKWAINNPTVVTCILTGKFCGF